ncbi:BREX system serine/threonine kinase PglW [Alkalimarinus alittae]|uniref:BREX system serine/threonine kinase PglW n=1 Tax=Alkalimarinus alittae TaxID=2961619 RepID=A0ABY6N485_9ALTE|nr:BREX system serine/threonine kinase PglW [Alkalimarinus alittae]UZE96938.1 BREX system serine/threonine kinase PglW [Alkalimarinus alittae]
MDKLWKQITPSDFAWEREALEFAKQALPDHDPYRAWANFEFIAHDGSINEIDLMVLTPKGLFLVEIKSHPGVIKGDAGTWIWEKPQGGQKLFDNPRILTDRKAKKLASLLQAQPSAKRSKERVPFINAYVFLSAENLVNKLEGPARLNVCTRKNFVHEITRMDEGWRHKRMNTPIAKMLSRAVEEAGIKESVRMRRVGHYELKEVLDESDHFQEWLAIHSELGIQRKVRIYLTYGKNEQEAKRLQKAAQLEFRLLEGIEHPGILKAKDYQQHDHGPALVYEYDSEAFRLDHLLLHLTNGKRLETMQAVHLMRLITEAVQYAHGQKLYHRALSPQSIWVKQDGDDYKIKISNWSTAERVYETETRQISALSHLSQIVQEEAGPYMALEAYGGGSADGVHMDVFSLGAIAYHLFTGKKPAENDLELQDKLSRGNGLQVTDEVNGASESVQFLVQYATHPDLSSRLESVDELIDCLDDIEEEITRPDTQRTANPTEAIKGDTFDGGITVKKRLGKGACSVAFLVDYQGHERVLKLALTPEHNRRIMQEGEALSKLRHQSIVAYHKTVEIAGHIALLIDYTSEGTLAQRIRSFGAVQLELLERFGDDLLSALAHLEDKAIVHRDLKPENIGLTKQGSQLHLVMFDFSLSNVGPDNITAGTLAYMDPFIRDVGRRRWDDFAERFSAALTLYEMSAGALPGWASSEGMPLQFEGELEVDRTVFDPTIRDRMVAFFKKALVRDVKERFSNAEDMLRAWREIFNEARKGSQHPTIHDDDKTCPITEAKLDTQIGLLELSPQALDTLSRKNINTVADLVKLNRSRVRVWMGVGVKTRTELSDVIGQLQANLLEEHQARTLESKDTTVISVDRIFTQVMPKVTKATDQTRLCFLNEYLGRLDETAPKGIHNVHWPTAGKISAHISLESSEVRELTTKVLTHWGKSKVITELRDEIISLLDENGGVMTAIELADAILLRRGSVQDSPLRERWAHAVVRVAVETELSKQEPRWMLRRSGNRFLIADDRNDTGEELADYANDLGELADECAEHQPLLSPVRALEKIRAVPAPSSFIDLSNHRLLRLAAAASQSAALSSRAEFYPRSMRAALALELAQGALLGSKALGVAEVMSRVAGRYPAAEPLPGRPQLDAMIQDLDIGFHWDGNYEFSNGTKGAYCLPIAGLTTLATRTQTQLHFSSIGETDVSSLQEIKSLNHQISNAVNTARFLALTVRPRQWAQAKDKLISRYRLKHLSFDELLLRHLHQQCKSMPKPPDWNVVLKADVAKSNSRDWQNLQRLVQRVLPAMAEEIKGAGQPVLLTEPGLIARYDLVNTWLSDIRRHLMSAGNVHGLILLIAADAQSASAVIDGVTVPAGAGSSEFARIPSVWLEERDKENAQVEQA